MKVVSAVEEIIPNPDGTYKVNKVVGADNIIAVSGAGDVGRCPVCGSHMYGHFEVMPEGSRWCATCGYMWPKEALGEWAKTAKVLDDED